MRNKEKRQKYTKEFKLEAVRMCAGRSIAEVARSHGITDKQLYRWRQTLSSEGDDAFRGQGKRTALEEENWQLKQRVRQLELEQEILKKAAAYFAKNLR